jgi:hypothetical protein
LTPNEDIAEYAHWLKIFQKYQIETNTSAFMMNAENFYYLREKGNLKMINIGKKIKVSVLAACVCATNAHAGITVGKIGNLFISTSSDVFSFSMLSDSQNFHTCAKQFLYSVSTSSQQGKNIYSAILAAKSSGQVVQIVGASKCDLAPNSGEDVIYISVLAQ